MYIQVCYSSPWYLADDILQGMFMIVLEWILSSIGDVNCPSDGEI